MKKILIHSIHDVIRCYSVNVRVLRYGIMWLSRNMNVLKSVEVKPG